MNFALLLPLSFLHFPFHFSPAWENAWIVLPYIGFLLCGIGMLWLEDRKQDLHL